MPARIPLIKAKFEMIQLLVGDQLKSDDLQHAKYLEVLLSALEHTYLQMNEELCQSLVMCKECAEKRDLLMQYMTLLDDLEFEDQLSEEEEKMLQKLPLDIQDTIDRIDKVMKDTP